jgi:hypothetical protein
VKARILVYIFLFTSIGYALFTGYKLDQLTKEENALRYDYAEMHLIKYGLFNLDMWKEKLFVILQERIDDFEITAKDLSSIEQQIELYLKDLYKEYFESGKLIDALVEARQGDDDEKKLGNLFVGLFRKNIEQELKNIDFEAQIPVITDNLMIELQRKIPDIKESISRSIGEMMAEELQSSMRDLRMPIYQKYGQETLETTDEFIATSLEDVQQRKSSFLLRCLAALALALFVLFAFWRKISFKEGISGLGLICTVFLGIGLALPMIDLDARLSRLNISLMGESIEFDEQVMYYQSKSIIDVTVTLLEGRGIDLKIVGLLILVFSIVLPFTKMLLSIIYLFNIKSRKSRFLRTIIFYMGKWSMADVFVVAIFMSYIGFYGLLSAMLGDVSNQSYSSMAETVNYSKLSPGVIFFTSYCLLSIVMSTLLNHRMPYQNMPKIKAK